MNVWVITEDKLRENKCRKSMREGQAVQFCEPNKGMMLGEEYDEGGEDEVQSEYLMKFLESSV